jgi:hypothetical protein
MAARLPIRGGANRRGMTYGRRICEGFGWQLTTTRVKVAGFLANPVLRQ